MVDASKSQCSGNCRFLQFGVSVPGLLAWSWEFLTSFQTAVWQAQARQAEGATLVGKWGGRGGDVGKLGVLQACPHLHVDPPLIHQAERARRCCTRYE